MYTPEIVVSVLSLAVSIILILGNSLPSEYYFYHGIFVGMAIYLILIFLALILDYWKKDLVWVFRIYCSLVTGIFVALILGLIFLIQREIFSMSYSSLCILNLFLFLDVRRIKQDQKVVQVNEGLDGRSFDYLKKNENGFTIIEILIVAILLGIMLTLIVPQNINQGEKREIKVSVPQPLEFVGTTEDIIFYGLELFKSCKKFFEGGEYAKAGEQLGQLETIAKTLESRMVKEETALEKVSTYEGMK